MTPILTAKPNIPAARPGFPVLRESEMSGCCRRLPARASNRSGETGRNLPKRDRHGGLFQAAEIRGGGTGGASARVTASPAAKAGDTEPDIS